MKYYAIDTLPHENPDLHVLQSPPPAIAHIDFRGREGCAFGTEFHSGVKVQMAKSAPERKLGGLVGNVLSYLILRDELLRLVRERDKMPDLLEVIPLSILDHKGKPVGNNYHILNPLDPLDCIDYDRSELEFDSTKKRILGIRRLVLREQALDARRALFRPQGYPRMIIGRADWLLEAKNRLTDVPRNIYVTELEVTAGSSAS